MSTPTPRTDAAQNNGCWTDDTVFYVPADFARGLERELAHRDALIQRILDYPYLPQNLATIIRKELDTK